MSDLDRIRRNVKRMVDQGAPEADIDEYVKGEGTTPALLRSFNTQSFADYDAARAQMPSEHYGLSPEQIALYQERRANDRYFADRAGNTVFGRLAESTGIGGRPSTAAADSRLLLDSLALGFRGEISSLGKTLYDVASGKHARGAKSFGERFGMYQGVEDALDRRAQQEASSEGKIKSFAAPLSIVPSAIAGAASGVQQAVGVIPSLAQFGREFLTHAPNVAKQGAAFGAAHAAGTAEGDILDRAAAAPGGAVTGSLLGLGIAGGVGGVMAARAGRQAAKQEAALGRLAQAQELEQAGLPVFGPAITGSGSASRMAETVMKNVAGAPLKERIGDIAEQTASRAQAKLREATGGLPPNDLGSNIQDTLRGAIRQHSRSPEEIRVMPNEQIETITGPVSSMGFAPPRPRVEPEQPRLIDPVQPNYERYRPQDEFVRGLKPEPKYPAFDDIPPPTMAEALRQEHRAVADTLTKRHADADAALRALSLTVDDAHAAALSRALPEQAISERNKIQAEIARLGSEINAVLGPARPIANGAEAGDTASIAARMKYADLQAQREAAFSRLEQLKSQYDFDLPKKLRAAFETGQWDQAAMSAMHPRDAAQVSALHREAVNMRQSVSRLSAESKTARETADIADRSLQDAQMRNWRAAVDDERRRAERVYEESKLAAQQQAARLRAEADAARETDRLRLHERDRVDAINSARQAEADRVWSEQAQTGAGFAAGRTRESYPTEFNAAYTRIERELPGERFNPFWRRPNQPESSMSRFMNELLDSGAGTLHLSGARRGIYDESGAIRQDLINYIRPRLGDDATAAIERLSHAAANNRGISPDGFRDIRTSIGRAIGNARDTGADAPLLRRLYAAMSDDMYASLERQGRGRQFTAHDATYTVDPAGTTVRDGRQAQRTYYVDPAMLERLSGGTVGTSGTRVAFSPRRALVEHSDAHGNRRIGFDLGEAGRPNIDGRSLIPFSDKPRAGLHPVEVFDDGARWRIGAAITDVAPSSGERAASMYRNVDSQYQTFAEQIRRPLSRIYGDKVSPLEAMTRLQQAAETGDLQTLRAFVRVLSEKDDPVRGGASIVAAMTKNAQSFQDFLAGMKRIPAESRNVLFAGEKGRSYLRDLETIERYATKLDPLVRASAAGLATTSNVSVGALAMVNIPTAIGAIAGQYAVAKFLASPAYVNWLTKVPRAMGRGFESAAMQAHLSRLAAIASEDSESGTEILRSVASALRPQRGN